ncbi:hypothetical protein M9H77_02949 [Catharanthus roseus]|uniref:Uncharacterized protein n=1 Tax=Catharanthus roseus TaxID=4058 RepID=A0ACC0C9X1_CATRO|nr:hypothetical protein M9H77_02949 [Catharanthus roseus]
MGTGIPKPYPRPWRVRSGSINFIPREYGSGCESMFHYKVLGLGLGVPRGSGPIYSPNWDIQLSLTIPVVDPSASTEPMSMEEAPATLEPEFLTPQMVMVISIETASSNLNVPIPAFETDVTSSCVVVAVSTESLHIDPISVGLPTDLYVIGDNLAILTQVLELLKSHGHVLQNLSVVRSSSQRQVVFTDSSARPVVIESARIRKLSESNKKTRMTKSDVGLISVDKALNDIFYDNLHVKKYITVKMRGMIVENCFAEKILSEIGLIDLLMSARLLTSTRPSEKRVTKKTVIDIKKVEARSKPPLKSLKSNQPLPMPTSAFDHQYFVDRVQF